MDIEDKTKKSVAPDIPGLKAMESTPNKEGASSPTTTDKLATAPDTAHFLKDQEVIATKGFTDVATKSVSWWSWLQWRVLPEIKQLRYLVALPEQ